MSHSFTVSIKKEQLESFREYYDCERIEDAVDEFKDEIIEKRDSIHEEVSGG